MKWRGMVIGLAAALLAPAHAAFAQIPDTSNPALSLNRTIRTTPFAETSVSMRDNEGSAYVPSDNSLWVADDNGDAIYEVDPTTGALKRQIPQSVFSDAVKLGGASAAGSDRSEDLEAIAYDVNSDHL